MQENRIFFDDEKVFESFFNKLKKRLDDFSLDQGIDDIFLLSPDDVDFFEPQFPCVSLEVCDPTTMVGASDYEEIEYYTLFAVELNVYTVNANKYKLGLAISNEIVRFFQEKMVVGGYYSRGLLLNTKTRTMSPNEELCRFVIRLSGKADNRNKLILPQ